MVGQIECSKQDDPWKSGNGHLQKTPKFSWCIDIGIATNSGASKSEIVKIDDGAWWDEVDIWRCIATYTHTHTHTSTHAHAQF